MTLRNLIQTTPPSAVFKALEALYSGHNPVPQNLGWIEDAYGEVITTLLAYPESIAQMPLYVRWEPPSNESKEGYYDILLRNPNYRPAPANLKAWDKAYDSNLYEPYFASGFTHWSEVINADVEFDRALPEDYKNPAKALAAILYELTFYGFQPDQIEDQKQELLDRVEDIESGKVKMYTLDEVTAHLKTITNKDTTVPDPDSELED